MEAHASNSADLCAIAETELAAGLNDQALRTVSRAIALDPASIACRMIAVNIHYRMGDMPAALAAIRTIVEMAPDDLAARRRYCRLLAECWQFDQADAAIAQALLRFSDDAVLLALAILVKQELGASAGARALASHAAGVYPDSAQFGLDAALMLPMIPTDAAALARSRKMYADGLAQVREQALPRWKARPEQVFSLERSNFLLAYQGADDLPLQRDYANLIGQLIEAADPSLRAPLTGHFEGGRRLRVGFVSKWFYASTVGNYFERWITRLDPARFERHIYYTGQTGDALTARIEAGCDRFVRLRADVRTNARQIQADRLDVLVHLEVGMSTGSYLMAAMRLAPVQCAAWGHPVTTGSDMIDCYFSCAPMEPAGGAGHYSEQVVLLDGIGVDLALPDMHPGLQRADLGLPAAGHLYFCPQSLFKIHPEMDDLLVKILAADTQAVLVFFQGGSRAVTLAFAERLTARIRAAGLEARGQVKFLPRLDGITFRRALAAADVVLDTLHWSGGGTSLDALAAEVPIVTLPGRFMRGRQTAAMLRMMQLDDLVVADADAYVRKSVEVAGIASLNADLRRTIKARKQAIFERADLSAGFAERLYDIGARRFAT